MPVGLLEGYVQEIVTPSWFVGGVQVVCAMLQCPTWGPWRLHGTHAAPSPVPRLHSPPGTGIPETAGGQVGGGTAFLQRRSRRTSPRKCCPTGAGGTPQVPSTARKLPRGRGLEPMVGNRRVMRQRVGRWYPDVGWGHAPPEKD